MTCDVPAERISAYADGELDPTAARELERHLPTCADCAATLAQVRALHGALAAPELRHRPSSAETRRLRAALQAAADASGTGEPRTGDGRSPAARRWLAAAALFAVAMGAFLAGRLTVRPEARDAVAEEIVANHVRSLLAEHLEDVASTDRHTVKPWFNGRLDFAPPVVDLAAAGFPLRGGRLDLVGERRVAALVYQSDRHVINVFVWPEGLDAGPDPAAGGALTVRGYHLEHWRQDGMTCWAVSDLEAGRLHEFALRLRAELGSSSPPASGGS